MLDITDDKSKNKTNEKLKVAVAVIALPRLEWPFITEWCQILAQKGVAKVFLGTDESTKVWAKKPNTAYYHLEMSDLEIKNLWDKAVEQARLDIEIETFPIAEPKRTGEWGCINEEQVSFLLKIKLICQTQGFDWLLNCDIDEIPVFSHGNSLADVICLFKNLKPDTCGIKLEQIVFESRWSQDNYKPKQLSSLSKYNPQVLPLCKYLFDVNRATPKTLHHSIETEGSVIRASSEILLLHHFRGVEFCISQHLAKIKDFPCTAAPLQSVPHILKHKESNPNLPKTVKTAEDFYDEVLIKTEEIDNLKSQFSPEDIIQAKFDTDAEVTTSNILFVLSAPRCGSNLLADLLYQNECCLLYEYFQTRKYLPILAERWNCISNGQLDKEAFVQSLLRFRTSKNGWLACKIHGHQLETFLKMEDLFPKVPKHFVYVCRRDLIAQAVSLSIARQTEKWTSQRQVKEKEILYNFSQISNCLETIQEEYSIGKEFLFAKDCQYQTIYYEDLVENPKNILEKLPCINSSKVLITEAQLQKQTTRVNEEWIERFCDEYPGDTKKFQLQPKTSWWEKAKKIITS